MMHAQIFECRHHLQRFQRMQAQQLHIDTIANNLANVNTTGFKKSRAEFTDLMYQTIIAPGASSSTTSTGVRGSRCIRDRISRPRRPRLRRRHRS